MKITRVYTRGGDKGTTSLVGGIRIAKSDIRLDAYGTIDELNSHIGLLIAMLQVGNASERCGLVGNASERCSLDLNFLIRIQNNLFIVGTHLATDQSKTPLYPSAILPEGETENLERRIDELMAQLPEAQGFVLPGGTVAAAQCHVCRTVCRRAERSIVMLAENAIVSPQIIEYVNRLSDYLFVLAKIINFNAGQSEIVWQKTCK